MNTRAAPSSVVPVGLGGLAPSGDRRGLTVLSDDPPAAAPWVRALADEGHVARCLAVDGTAGRALQPSPDAVVLHLAHGVPQHLARLRELRAALPQVPLLTVCTGLRDLDHVLALEMGADDVIDAAVAAPVVAARLRALWRRSGESIGEAPPPQQLTFGRLQLQRAEQRALLQQRTVPLSGGEFDLLWLLALRAGQAVPRTDLVRRLRGLDYERDDRSVDCRIYRIRGKLGDADPAARRIRTVRNVGYLFLPSPW